MRRIDRSGGETRAAARMDNVKPESPDVEYAMSQGSGGGVGELATTPTVVAALGAQQSGSAAPIPTAVQHPWRFSPARAAAAGQGHGCAHAAIQAKPSSTNVSRLSIAPRSSMARTMGAYLFFQVKRPA